MIARLLLLLVFLGCSRTEKPIETKDDIQKLQEKRDLYLELMNQQKDDFGFVGPKCDGLLFNSLARYSGAYINVFNAEESPGRWRRHPDFTDCKPFQGSKSTISRDMFRGLFLVLLSEKRVDAMERIKSYGQANDWAMGEAEDAASYWGRVWWPPTLRHQLDRMIDKTRQNLSQASKQGFEGHLEVLSIFTEYLINGAISELEVRILEEYARNNPKNGLYQAIFHKFTDGDQSKAVELLMDERLFPSDRLPTDRDRFAHYLWERDDGPDYQPCNEQGSSRICNNTTHSGIDLVFAVRMLE